MNFFIVNGCWILSNAFSALIDMIIWFLSFILLLCCITLTDLLIFSQPCIPGINAICLWCMILPMYFKFILLIFCSGFSYMCSLELLVYNLFFLWWSLSAFGFKVMLALENEFTRVPSSMVWKSLRRFDVNSSLNVL